MLKMPITLVLMGLTSTIIEYIQSTIPGLFLTGFIFSEVSKS